MGKPITKEQIEYIVANHRKMEAKTIILHTGLPDGTVYRIAKEKGLTFIKKKELGMGMAVSSPIAVEGDPPTKTRKGELTAYILANHQRMTATQMAEALQVNLENLEEFAFTKLNITLEGALSKRRSTGWTRPPAIYDNRHISQTAKEYWEEETKHRPVKKKPTEDE